MANMQEQNDFPSYSTRYADVRRLYPVDPNCYRSSGNQKRGIPNLESRVQVLF